MRPIRANVGALRRPFFAGLAALLALQACVEPSTRAAVPDDSVYVQVMARLTFIRQTAERSGTHDTLLWADSVRMAVLDAYGVDGAALERYAARYGGDPSHMEAIWARVGEVVDHIALRAARSEGPLDLGPGAGAPLPGGEDETAGADEGNGG